MVIDEKLLDQVSTQAKGSLRLRMNYNFHQSLDEKCHRFLNAVEPGTEVPIHKHPTKDETFVLLRDKVRVTTHNDDGSILDEVVLCPEEGTYGVNIPKGVWHRVESLASDSCLFECKEGPFIPHEVDGILDIFSKERINNLKIKYLAFMEQNKKKNYPPPQVWVIELKCESKILTTSGNGGGELPPNPNYSI